MVFIALPALQRNQRDTARRNDVGIVASAVTNWQSNNRGANPGANAQADFRRQVGDVSQHSQTGDGLANVVIRAGVSNTNVTEGQILVLTGATCDGSTPVSAQSRQVAVVTMLENGSRYCQGV